MAAAAGRLSEAAYEDLNEHIVQNGKLIRTVLCRLVFLQVDILPVQEHC
jgi:hypothetical protein